MSELTVEQVEARIAQILANVADPEGAHWDEDLLVQKVVRAVADGDEQGQALARALLPLFNAKRERWYA